MDSPLEGKMDEFTPEFIAEQLALAAKATPRPWRGDRYDGTVKYGIKCESDNGYVLLYDDNAERSQFSRDLGDCDDEYIIASANNYPAALEEIARLRDIVKLWHDKFERTKILYLIERAARVTVEERIASLRSQFDVWRELNPDNDDNEGADNENNR